LLNKQGSAVVIKTNSVVSTITAMKQFLKESPPPGTIMYLPLLGTSQNNEEVEMAIRELLRM
jgi:hypothetical protein